jgi:DinB superfamily
MDDRTWTQDLLEQLTWHWDHQVRPGLETMTDDEYFWEPAPGCWSVRPRDEATTPLAAGGGALVMDWGFPTPAPPPLTTIAWRLGHVLVGVFGMRNASHFGGPPVDFTTAVWPATADAARAALDREYDAWVRGVATLDDDALARPVGEAEGVFAAFPYRALVLHIHREAIHHLAEVLLLRDLYRTARGG